MSRFPVHDLNFSVTVMVFPVRSETGVTRDELVVEKLQYPPRVTVVARVEKAQPVPVPAQPVSKNRGSTRHPCRTLVLANCLKWLLMMGPPALAAGPFTSGQFRWGPRVEHPLPQTDSYILMYASYCSIQSASHQVQSQ